MNGKEESDMVETELKIQIDSALKTELEGAAEYAEENLSVFCAQLLRDGLRVLQAIEMEY